MEKLTHIDRFGMRIFAQQRKFTLAHPLKQQTYEQKGKYHHAQAAVAVQGGYHEGNVHTPV